MNLLEAFLFGFLVGVIGCLAMLLIVKRRKRLVPEGPKAENPSSAGGAIGHDRGIEVFDD
jgi:hypothetical protein